jgi:hypothetical protein
LDEALEVLFVQEEIFRKCIEFLVKVADCLLIKTKGAFVASVIANLEIVSAAAVGIAGK